MPLLKTSFNRVTDKKLYNYCWHTVELFYFIVFFSFKMIFNLNDVEFLLILIAFIVVNTVHRHKRSRTVIEFTPQQVIIQGQKYPYSEIDCIYTKQGDAVDENNFSIYPSDTMLYIQLKKGRTFKFRKRTGYYFNLNNFSKNDAHDLLENFKKHHVKYKKCDIYEICRDEFLDFLLDTGKYFLISVFVVEVISRFLALFFD